MSSNVEDVFAYAETGSRGAAKFKTEDAMWDYEVSNKGQHNYQHGGNKVYVKAGGLAMLSRTSKRKLCARQSER